LQDINYSLKLCSYYFVSKTFDDGKNVFHSFIPILESVFHSNPIKDTFSFLEIQNLINSNFDVKIPKETLRQLLDALQYDGKIRFEKNRIIIDREIYDSNYWSNKTNIENSISDLFFAFREYLLGLKIKCSLEQIKEIICTYIYSYSKDLADFLGGYISTPKIPEDADEYVCELLDFLVKIKNENNRHHIAIQHLYSGAIQTSLLNFAPEKIKSLQHESQIEHALLDSNFVMRVINIQTELESEMAMDTYRTLCDMSVNLYVFKQTLKEISNSISSFLNDIEGYSANTRKVFSRQSIKTNGIWSAYQTGRITRTQLLDLSKLTYIENKMLELGITVIEEDMPDFSSELITDLIRAKNKDYYRNTQAKHDLFLIDYCRRKRPNKVSEFSAARWWVITNDIKLTFWNQNNKNTDVQECITESQLSNILWISAKKNDNDGLINTIVALANNKSLNFTEIKCFKERMDIYYEEVKSDPQKLDQYSVAFASDRITRQDIRNVNENIQELSEIITDKYKEIEKEKEENEKYKQSLSDKNIAMEMKLADLNNKIVLSNHNNNLLVKERELDALITHEEKLLDKIKSGSNLVGHHKKLIKREGRKLLLIYAICAFAVTFLAIILWLLPSQPVHNIVSLLNISSTIYGPVFTLSYSIFIYILSFIVSVVITGEPKSFIKLFIHLRDEQVSLEVERYIDEKCLDISHISDLKDYLGELEKQRVQLTANKESLTSEKQDLEYMIRNMKVENTNIAS